MARGARGARAGGVPVSAWLLGVIAALAIEVSPSDCPTAEAIRARLGSEAITGRVVAQFGARLALTMYDDEGTVVASRSMTAPKGCDARADLVAVLVRTWSLEHARRAPPPPAPSPPPVEERAPERRRVRRAPRAAPVAPEPEPVSETRSTTVAVARPSTPLPPPTVEEVHAPYHAPPPAPAPTPARAPKPVSRAEVSSDQSVTPIALLIAGAAVVALGITMNTTIDSYTTDDPTDLLPLTFYVTGATLIGASIYTW